MKAEKTGIKDQNGKDAYYLVLSDEESDKLHPFLNRYGLLDRFPEKMPKPIEVFDWMFPESIKEIKMSKEKLNFSRSGIGKIYEKMMKGELTEEDLHQAAANTEAILREKGVDLTVTYMGTYQPEKEKKRIQVTFEHFKKE